MYLASNPFITSFYQSDLFGKFIFIILFTLSIISWCLLISKIKTIRALRTTGQELQVKCSHYRQTPLNIQLPAIANPFYTLYRLLQKNAAELLAKNQTYGQETFSGEDIEQISHNLASEVSHQAKELERNLFILSTTVSLAPFLGLLGTVWGILITLADLQVHAASLSLAGMSMALSTTVLGLLVAIPPLIGYNYLRARLRELTVDMHTFSRQMLAAVELQYRSVNG